jgi:REP element-mobilizing transposase RayT
MGNTYTNLLIHTIFSTKGRRPLIHDAFRERLHEYLGGLARHEFLASLGVGGTANHVHGLLALPATLSVAEAMRKWKGLSSKWVHETLPGESDFGWQEGYAAFSVSRSNVPKVAAYIAGQAEHHRTMTFEDELVALLKRHGVEYDPRYVFD